MDISFSEAAELLKSRDNYVIFTHTNADADTLGSALALAIMLKRLDKSVTLFNPLPISAKMSFLPETCGMTFTDALPSDESTLVSVDIATAGMLRGIPEERLNSIVFELCIDHHDINTIPCRNRVNFPGYISCGEVVEAIGEAMGISIDKEVAYPLYAAISSDSGCFRYGNTRPETHLIAEKLLRTGIDFSKINRLIFDNKSPNEFALERAAYNSLELFFGGRVAVVCLENVEGGEVNEQDLNGVHNIPRSLAGVEVSAVIRRMDDQIKVSLRSNDYYDVAALAASFGGGGHKQAAACRFRTSIEDAKAKLLDELANEFTVY